MKKLLLLFGLLSCSLVGPGVINSYGQTPAQKDSIIDKRTPATGTASKGTVTNGQVNELLKLTYRNISTTTVTTEYEILQGGIVSVDTDADDSFSFLITDTTIWRFRTDTLTLAPTSFVVSPAAVGMARIDVPCLVWPSGTFAVVHGAESSGAVSYPAIPSGYVPLQPIQVYNTTSVISSAGYPRFLNDNFIIRPVSELYRRLEFLEYSNGPDSTTHFDLDHDSWADTQNSTIIEVVDPITGKRQHAVSTTVPIFPPVADLTELAAIGTLGDTSITFSSSDYPTGYIINVVGGKIFELSRTSVATPNDSTIIAAPVGNWLAKTSAGGGGIAGHILKYNGTTLTQRATLQVLSDDDVSPSPILRDSSANSSSILDLRDYVSRFGTATGRPLDGYYQLTPDGVVWQTTSGDAYNTTGRVELEYRGFRANYVSDRGSAAISIRQNVDSPDLSFFVNSTDEVLGQNRERLSARMLSNNAGATFEILSETDPSSSFIPTFKGISYAGRFGAHYLPYDSASSVTTWDFHIPDVKFVKDAIAAGGSGGSVPTKIIRDTTNTSNNTLSIDKVSSGEGLRYNHSKDLYLLEMYGGDYGSPGDPSNPYFSLSRGDNSFLLAGGNGAIDGSSGDWSGIRGDRQYWLSSFYGDYHFVQKGGMDAAIAAAVSAASLPSQTGNNGKYLTTNGTTASWGTVSSGITSPLTTKGDIWGYSTTQARLPVGANGYALLANSSQATGLIWSDLSTLYFPLQGGNITGTGGAGFIGFPAQSSDPSTPASGVVVFARSTGGFSWKGTNGFKRSFIPNGQTADRTYRLQNADMTLADSAVVAGKEPAITTGTSIQYWNGAKSFVNFGNSVRNAYVAQSLSLSNTAIVATDSVSVAFGKAQGQINANVASIATNTSNISTNTTNITSNTNAITLTQQSHTSGTTVTISSASGPLWLIINPASVLAAVTVTMPATPVDGQRVEISFGGTMTTGTVVTALTISPNTSQAILQATTPNTAEAGEVIAYRWKSSVSKWYRLN